MYSFVIKKAIDVIRAELLVLWLQLIGLTIDNVGDTIVELDFIKISEEEKCFLFV